MYIRKQVKTSVYILFILFLAVTITSCKETPKPVADSRKSDYALYDASGGFHRLSTYNNKEAIVLWVQGNGCPIVRNALEDFHTIVTEYSEKGFQFFMVNSNIQDDRAEIAMEAKEYNFKVPVLVDNAQLIAEELDITITAEAIVLHPTTRKILYRGPLNNRLDYEAQKEIASETYLRDALDAIAKGKTPKNKQEVTRGCTVTRLSNQPNKKDLTYTKDIAPILAESCVRCHRDNGIAPWAMEDYQTVTGWSAMIKEVLLSKRMPPWKADPTVNEFKNSFALADSNARKIISWIDAGMPPGIGKDTLQGLTYNDAIWQRGRPDKIIALKEEKLPANRLIPYRYQTFDLELEKDTWLKGVEIKPGNPKALHHIVLTNKATNKRNAIVNRKIWPYTDNYIALGGGVDQLTMFPEGTGVYLPKGTSLTVQIHYTPTGKEDSDKTKIGFYYHDTPPKQEFYALSPSNSTFKIPPHTNNVKIVAADTITKDINIHYIVPHMHYRGKSIKMSIIAPNGKVKELISVPDFSFNWQWLYQLKDPMFAPKGSIIQVEGIYDNTVQNPLNPDPSQELHFGIQSTDEMLIGFFNYTLADR
ncbi:copper type II ascorbate-dependent monooxygenase-like protein [Marinirhabdus gelatinilytica]|uniref:Copper type II ascorbate-dependent monooxygenase-like protein n=1 Tax=Marinirhabdus gelatinilytica TaxID=1703343 RepID=A0A370QAP9_9FLAO|nr:copper type II ascorbate-dependent monooxygenase-like protein [Marinirhabdus gelatinilytica]